MYRLTSPSRLRSVGVNRAFAILGQSDIGQRLTDEGAHLRCGLDVDVSRPILVAVCRPVLIENAPASFRREVMPITLTSTADPTAPRVTCFNMAIRIADYARSVQSCTKSVGIRASTASSATLPPQLPRG